MAGTRSATPPDAVRDDALEAPQAVDEPGGDRLFSYQEIPARGDHLRAGQPPEAGDVRDEHLRQRVDRGLQAGATAFRARVGVLVRRLAAHELDRAPGALIGVGDPGQHPDAPTSAVLATTTSAAAAAIQ